MNECKNGGDVIYEVSTRMPKSHFVFFLILRIPSIINGKLADVNLHGKNRWKHVLVVQVE